MIPLSLAEQALAEQEIIEDLLRRIAELEDAIRRALPYLEAKTKAVRAQGIEILEDALEP